jgi:hypothetical protein
MITLPAMKINVLRYIDPIVDASRFDSSNPVCESPGTGLINQAPTIAGLDKSSREASTID